MQTNKTSLFINLDTPMNQQNSHTFFFLFMTFAAFFFAVFLGFFVFAISTSFAFLFLNFAENYFSENPENL